MPKAQRLVRQHLEKVSWKVLDEYPDVVRDLIRKRFGIYALYKGERLYYVGLANNLMGRLKQHLKDRHHGAWDRFSVYLTAHNDHIRELESLMLRMITPPGNKVGGRLTASKNLFAALNQRLTEADRDRRADLLGGWVAKRRRRTIAKRAKGVGALKGLVIKRMVLKGYQGEWEYNATLRMDGTIRYDNKIYDTPNAAARAAVGKAKNGWNFWRYKDVNGKWLPLKNLKT